MAERSGARFTVKGVELAHVLTVYHAGKWRIKLLTTVYYITAHVKWKIKMDFILKRSKARVFYSVFIKLYENKFKCAYNYTHVHIHESVLSNQILFNTEQLLLRSVHIYFFIHIYFFTKMFQSTQHYITLFDNILNSFQFLNTCQN